MKSLRRVVIIGNGYDIAHGLESSYNSFILNYFKTVFNKVVESGYYDDELISIDCSELFINKNACFILIKESDKLSDLFKVTKLREIKNAISFNNDYFKELISESIQNEKNWIDIEKFYYNQLTFILRLEEQYRKDKIIDLNNFLDLITDILETYLTKIQDDWLEQSKATIQDMITPYIKYEGGITGITNLKRVLFINFNYTRLLNFHSNQFNTQYLQTINIHGELKNTENPLIFGYGDDTTELYSNIEDLDDVDFLIKFKSHKYQQTDNYDKILGFIEHSSYDVSIVGHSCGLSDRTLLKTIFEHNNCRNIKAFHYKESKEDALTEHFYKSIAISRHFKNKPSKLKKLLPFDIDAKIIQSKKK